MSGNDHDLIELRVLRRGETLRLTRIRCEKPEIVDEDPAHPLPPLATLSAEEQVFVVAFLRSHGNIREMEGLFNISYPTVKKRLNAIVAKLDAQFQYRPADPRSEVLAQLERGEISAEEALARLS